MARIWRKPPDGRGGLPERVVLANGFDPSDISPPALPRKRAAGPQSLGPCERAAARACRERGFRVIEGGRT